jgi:hypothetical protein
MMKILSFALLLLGLLLAPAYWIHAKFYSGSQAAVLTLTPVASQAGGQSTWQSDAFSLRADMAPVGLVLMVQGRLADNVDAGNPPRDLYTATLSRNLETAKPLGFSIGVKRVSDMHPQFHEHLLLLQKVRTGQYRLLVSAVNPPAIQVEQMQLQIQQHVHEPDPRVVTAGILMFILGILGLVIG